MTLRATRELDYIVVTATCGPATFTISEHASHVATFWGQLGALLSEAEKTRTVPYVEVVELPEPSAEPRPPNPGDAA